MTNSERVRGLLRFTYPDSPVKFCELCHELSNRNKHYPECKANEILRIVTEQEDELKQTRHELESVSSKLQLQEELLSRAAEFFSVINFTRDFRKDVDTWLADYNKRSQESTDVK